MIVKSRDLELEVQFDQSGKPTAARVTNHTGYPDCWFTLPKGTSLEQVQQFTRGMEIACWRAGYQLLLNKQEGK
jgi:hypothetical protein